MKNISYKIHKHDRAFSLAEVLAALTIGAMVLVAVLSIYSRAEHSAAAIGRKLDGSQLPSEVLQRIAEDIDRIVVAGLDAKIRIENKFENGFSTARLEIVKTIYNDKNKKQTFEKIIWQTSYDNDANGLVLYRSYEGIGSEDKLLDEKRKDWEKSYSFVPICTGVTFFKVQSSKGETLQDKWTSDSLPNGIVVTISFAAPFKTVSGVLDVLDVEKIMRTIAIDRTRKIKFIFVKREYSDDEQEGKDKEEDSSEEDVKEEQGNEDPNSK